MKKLALFSTLFFLSLFIVSGVRAEYGAYQPSTFSYSITVDKLVGRPNGNINDTKNYVDNIPSGDRYFTQGEDIWFQVKVKNTSNTTITGVTLRDFVPTYVDPIDGIGTFDSGSRVITANIGDFAAGEEKIYYFKMRANLPSNISASCLNNKAEGYNDKVNDSDVAQFCIEQKTTAYITPTVTSTSVKGEMTKVEKVPSAGPEYAIFIAAFSAVSGLVGLKLRKTR